MLLLFSSSMSGVDVQVQLLEGKLKECGCEYRIINPHDLISAECSLSQCSGELELYIGGQKCAPTAIYVVNNWRSDAIIRVPSSCDYPGVYRSKIQQFLQDLRFCFEGVNWIPGKLERVERADSKLFMFQQAHLHGLNVPARTVNSFVQPHEFKGRCVYQKCLGFPFVISLNKRKGVEVGVTTTNVLHEPIAIDPDGQPWQWQSSIRKKTQIRCFVVKERVWSVSCSVSADSDLRELGQVDQKQIAWSTCDLPDEISARLVGLIGALSLNVAAPEFLVSNDGNHTLIDLNPCGDWFGFFPEAERLQIASSLAQLCKEQTQ